MNLFKALSLGFLTTVVIGCSGNVDSKADRIRVDFDNTISSLVGAVESIELIPLENDGTHLLGSSIGFSVVDSSFILADYMNGNIFRYSSGGRLVNSIGCRGNGPEEYVHINDVQCRNSTVYVFSVPSRIQRFSLEGSMLDMTVLNEMDLGAMSWMTDDGVLTYYGYGTGRKARFSLLSGDSKSDFYPSKDKVMNYTPNALIFSVSGDSVFVVDSYSDIIKIYCDRTMFDGPRFDFGKYSIPRSFYEYNDPYSSMDSLLGSEFAMINRFFSDGDRRFVSITLQKHTGLYNYCGLCKKGEWSWFAAGEEGNNLLYNSFHCMSDGVLYCLWDPSKLTSLPASLKKLVLTPNVLDETVDDGNYIVAKLNLL